MVERRLLLALGALALLVMFCPSAFAVQETQYMAVFVHGAKVGYSVHTRTVEADKVTTSERTSFTIDRLGTPVAVQMVETCMETAAGKPLSFESVYEFGATTNRVAGTVSEKGTAALTILTMGKEEKHTILWPAGTLMAEGYRLLIREKTLALGTTYTARVFKPRLAQAVNEEVSIGKKKLVNLLSGAMGLTEVTTITTLLDGERFTSTSYLDDSFRIHRGRTSIGDMQIELYACRKEFALNSGAPLDLLERMFVPSPEPIRDIESASIIAYTLTPAQDANVVIPSTDNQKATRLWNGKISVEVKPVDGRRWASFPYKGDNVELLEATRPTRYVQSDRKEVIELARKAIGNARHGPDAARRIESFVAQYIESSMSVGYASAAEIVEKRQGDCSEFAVLTAALCRAVGIPAQVVVGMAYADNIAGRSGFAGHAWTRAYLGTDAQGAWVGLDAAFARGDRGGYGAGHIALAFGSEPDDFANIAALSQLTVDRIEVRRRR